MLHTIHEMLYDTTGHSDVTSRSIDAKAQTDLPEFAMLDLISSYVLGERKRVYKGRAKTAHFNKTQRDLLSCCLDSCMIIS